MSQFTTTNDADRLNKAGDVAALSLRPSDDGFIVKTTCRLYITCHRPTITPSVSDKHANISHSIIIVVVYWYMAAIAWISRHSIKNKHTSKTLKCRVQIMSLVVS